MSQNKEELLERYLEFTPNMSNAEFSEWVGDVTELFVKHQDELQTLSIEANFHTTG